MSVLLSSKLHFPVVPRTKTLAVESRAERRLSRQGWSPMVKFASYLEPGAYAAARNSP